MGKYPKNSRYLHAAFVWASDPLLDCEKFLSYNVWLFSVSMFQTIINCRTIINLQDLYIINSTST